MGQPLRVLIVEDCENDALLVERALARGGYSPEVARVETAEDMEAALDAREWDVILSDYALPYFNAPDALRLVQTRELDVPFIMVSGAVSGRTAVAIMRLGARDYIMKDNLTRLVPAVRRELREAQQRRQRRRAEEALRESEENYRAIFDAANDAIFVHDIQTGEILDVNRKMCEMYGYTAQEARELDVGALSAGEPPHTQTDAMEWIRKAADGQAQVFEQKARDKAGRHFWVEVNLKRAVIGGKDRLLAVVRDITGRRQVEEEIERLAKFPGENPNPMLRVSREGTVLYANAASEPLLSLFKSGIGGRLSARWREEVAGVFRAGVPREITLECSERVFSLMCVPVTSAEYVNLYGRDITEQRALQEQLREAAKLESIGRLAGGMAHDFNNILTGTSGYAQLLLARVEEGSPMCRDLEQIRDLSNRAANLIRQLLAFSRRQPIEPVVFNMNSLVKSTSSMLQRLIGEDIELEFAAAPDLGNIRADPEHIAQVLMNLAVNSRDAMPQGGKLTIKTANVTIDDRYAGAHVGVAPGDWVLLVVTDTGCGMDAATRERIFEPFFTTKERGKGTGLGLASVYGIVKQNRGHIWVHSEPGHGTSFKIYLPRVQARAQSLEKSVRREATTGGSETILLVEDETSVRELATRVLEEKGYTVHAAASSSEAEHICGQDGDETALLLTDVVLPGCNGRELYERISARFSGLKVLYTSGYSDDAVAGHGMLEAGTAFLEKPFGPDALARKVREVLDSG